MQNQWGQKIAIGDTVGYASKSGSYTSRKLGVVTGFGERGDEDVAFVHWRWEGGGKFPMPINEKGSGVGINRLFHLSTATLSPEIIAGLQGES